VDDSAQPHSDQGRTDRASDEESSSKAHPVDITPPKDDAKNHPFSSSENDEDQPPSDVQDFHPWNPHKAAKDVEVGEFYLKRKNYRAAIDRFREALIYKPNDAIATFRLGEAQEKIGQFDEARANYEGYLKILPEGPLSQDAHKAIERLASKQSKNDKLK
jgi:tetratricopeptide (TPR) repeat protein